MILSDYTGLIPGQNSNRPRFMVWVAANLQPLVDSQAASLNLYSAFILNTAVGVQLDLIGQELGQSRTVDFVPEGGVSARLSDDLYRLILKAAVLKNTWKGTKKEIYDFWAVTFPAYPITIIDNQDMSMTYSIFGLPLDPSALTPFSYDDPNLGYGQGYWVRENGGLLRELINHHYLTPKPAGVSVSYLFPTQVLFAYGQNSTYLQGYDTGNWIGT